MRRPRRDSSRAPAEPAPKAPACREREATGPHPECNICRRLAVEHRIVCRIVDDALSQGLLCTVSFGDDDSRARFTIDRALIIEEATAADESFIRFHRNEDPPPAPFGWCFLVFGNSGWDVISDYTSKTESVLEGALALAEELSP